METTIDDELRAEIESFRAELRARSEERERSMSKASSLDLPSFDATQLELPQIKALIAERYQSARVLRRLDDLERRLAAVEARDG